jgi:hypothetical protein
MKNKYLNEIKTLLAEYEISASEVKDILSDYSNMYEDGLARGLTDAAVIEYLGKPEKVVAELGENYSRIEKSHKSTKIIALMPFLCTMAFFALGFSPLHAWHPGWMVFLLIPVSAIVLNMGGRNSRHLLTALSPFIAVGAYMWLGFGPLHAWHPGWLVFFLIPVIAILSSAKDRGFLETLTALMPFAAVTAFIFLGQAGFWNPGWLVFLLIPMIGILNMKNKFRMFCFELCFLASIGAYLYAGYGYGRWDLGALAFAIPLCYGILINEIKISFGMDGSLPVKLTVLFALIVFFAGGFLFAAWPYLWLVFLLIPVVAILTNARKKDRFVAISPFISVTVFFLLGYFGGFWAYSWMVFFLIPIAGILKSK